MNEFHMLDQVAGAMAVQSGALEVLARNVAAASVAGSAGYTRFVPQMSLENALPHLEIRREHQATNGNLLEMLAVMDAQRAYEADASVFAVGKRLIEHTLDLERQ